VHRTSTLFASSAEMQDGNESTAIEAFDALHVIMRVAMHAAAERKVTMSKRIARDACSLGQPGIEGGLRWQVLHPCPTRNALCDKWWTGKPGGYHIYYHTLSCFSVASPLGSCRSPRSIGPAKITHRCEFFLMLSDRLSTHRGQIEDNWRGSYRRTFRD
jgi:hypothetical protein